MRMTVTAPYTNTTCMCAMMDEGGLFHFIMTVHMKTNNKWCDIATYPIACDMRDVKVNDLMLMDNFDSEFRFAPHIIRKGCVYSWSGYAYRFCMTAFTSFTLTKWPIGRVQLLYVCAQSRVLHTYVSYVYACLSELVPDVRHAIIRTIIDLWLCDKKCNMPIYCSRELLVFMMSHIAHTLSYTQSHIQLSHSFGYDYFVLSHTQL